jgi:hypothetical protein
LTFHSREWTASRGVSAECAYLKELAESANAVRAGSLCGPLRMTGALFQAYRIPPGAFRTRSRAHRAFDFVDRVSGPLVRAQMQSEQLPNLQDMRIAVTRSTTASHS